MITNPFPVFVFVYVTEPIDLVLSVKTKEMEGPKEPLGLRAVGSHCSLSEMDDFDLTRALDKPRLKIERKRSFDERSMSELSTGYLRQDSSILDMAHSPGSRSIVDTPLSYARNSFEPHPMVAEAWEALRRSMVFFRGQPVGTIAAYDHASEEVLNYDQVIIPIQNHYISPNSVTKDS